MTKNCGTCKASATRDADTVYCRLNPPVQDFAKGRFERPEASPDVWRFPVCSKTAVCHQWKALAL